MIAYLLHSDNRSRFGSVLVIYGARAPGELMYRNELAEWQKRGDVDVQLTVDKAENGWDQHVGVVPAVLDQLKPSPDNALAIVCGPPIMLKFTLAALEKLGFADDTVILSL